MTAIMLWFCTDCLAGNCTVCLDLGPQLDDGTVCECEHDDLEFDRRSARERRRAPR